MRAILLSFFAIGLVLVLTLTVTGRAQDITQDGAQLTISRCVDGTVATYIGTTCSQLPSVFTWTRYTCTSTPSSICDSLGANGEKIHMRMDGEGNHTILVSASDLWNVTAGQSIDVMIRGTVYGAITNVNWPHFYSPGHTGDGTEENKTTVYCAPTGNCVKLKGVSDILCDADSPDAYCNDQNKIDPYLSATAKFNRNTSDNPYRFTIEIKLNGGTNGTATIHSVGVHIAE